MNQFAHKRLEIEEVQSKVILQYEESENEKLPQKMSKMSQKRRRKSVNKEMFDEKYRY